MYMYKFLVIWKITVGHFYSFFSLFCLVFSSCSHHLCTKSINARGHQSELKRKKCDNSDLSKTSEAETQVLLTVFWFRGQQLSDVLLCFIVDYPVLLFFVYQQISVAYRPKINSPRCDLVKCCSFSNTLPTTF